MWLFHVIVDSFTRKIANYIKSRKERIKLSTWRQYIP